MTRPCLVALVAAVPVLAGCNGTDTATFVTATNIGIAADAKTEQVHIGFDRVELFQGPNYPDTGDAPQVVGFIGSDLAVFQPHIRQLYATGAAAGYVTMPNAPAACPAPPVAGTAIAPNLCAEAPAAFTGDRRPMVFGTGTTVGLKLGFIADAPSSIKFGYNREELSIIPLHKAKDSSGAITAADQYTSVLASLDMNLKTGQLPDTDLMLTQFFATGAAARNLAKRPEIRETFRTTAAAAVDANKVTAAATTLTKDDADIAHYFAAKAQANVAFATARDALLNDPALGGLADSFSAGLKTAGDANGFIAALNEDPLKIEPIADVARRDVPPA